MKQHHPFAPYLAVIASVIFWGLSFVATKIVLESIPPVTLLFIRFSVASCFFSGLDVVSGLSFVHQKRTRTHILRSPFSTRSLFHL